MEGQTLHEEKPIPLRATIDLYEKWAFLGRFVFKPVAVGQATWIMFYVWVLLTLIIAFETFFVGNQNVAYRLAFALMDAFVLTRVFVVTQEMPPAGPPKAEFFVRHIFRVAALAAALLLYLRVVEGALLALWREGYQMQLSAANSFIGRVEFGGSLIASLLLCVALVPLSAYLELERAIAAEAPSTFPRKDDPAFRPIVEGLEPLEVEPLHASHDHRLAAESWYFERDGKVVGPFTEGEMKALLKSDQISSHTLVYNAALGGEWRELEDTYYRYGIKRRRRPSI